MAADLPDTDGNDDGPDLSPLEILLRRRKSVPVGPNESGRTGEPAIGLRGSR